MTYTLAGLLMLAAALVGAFETIRPLHTISTTSPKTADHAGRRFISPEEPDERNMTR